MWRAPAITVHRSFAQGELAPSVYGRADLALYHQAARTIRNFLVRRQGGADNRPGTVYVGTVKDSTSAAYLFPFIFAAADESYIVVAQESHFRFVKDGAFVSATSASAYSGATAYTPGDVVSSGGTYYYCIANTTGNAPPNATYWYALTSGILEVPHTFTAGQFQNPAPLCWDQSGLIVTLSHLNSAPKELVLSYVSGATFPKFYLRSITTAPTLSAPTGLGSSGTVVGTLTRRYVVTAVGSGPTFEESIASSTLTLSNILEPTELAAITVTFGAVSGASEYRVYLDDAGNGVFGYLGTTTSTSFVDPGYAADFLLTPPQARVLFAGANEYPAVNATYQQRRIFAGTHTDRETAYASRIGLPSNFSIRSPLQDDDAVTFKLAAKFVQPIVHLVSTAPLVVLTDTGEWVVYGDESGVITPTGINLDQKGSVGSGFLTPVVVGDRIIYQQARGARLRDLQYTSRGPQQGLGSRDLTVLASHLFQGYTIVDLAYAHEPHSIIWAVRSDGTLLGCTYVPEDDTWGFHQHDTSGGDVTQVCVIPEDQEDRVYVVVLRGSTYMVERLASRLYSDVADAIFVDSAVTYSGASATAMSGLSHLNGSAVYAWTTTAAGQAVQGPYTVSGGAITLGTAATKAQIGLAITADLELLDMDSPSNDLRGRRKRVASVGLLLEASYRGFQVGRDSTSLLTSAVNTWEANTPFTGLHEIAIKSTFDSYGRVFIRHTHPRPLSIHGVLPVFEQGQ
jgi:hypothetical protein